jgi:enolase
MDRTKIASVTGRRVWDSRGRPTVEVEVALVAGARGRAMAPAGASVGTGEALDLRDGGERFAGLDVTRAVSHVNGEITRAIAGIDALDQARVDECLILLDGTPSKSRLGGNACVAVSLASARAAAAATGQPLYRHIGGLDADTLPVPHVQIFGGAAHGAPGLNIQDYMVMCPGARSFAEAVDWTAEIYRAAGTLLTDAGDARGVTDSGGWWPRFNSNEHGLEVLVRAIELAGFSPGMGVGISIDVAASEFGHGGTYTIAPGGRRIDTEAMIKLLLRWVRRFPIMSIEDPLADDDHPGFVALTRQIGNRVQIIADDLVTSDMGRMHEAALRRSANAVLLKPNQRGTLTEVLRTWHAARQAGFRGVIATRSGETEDVSVIDLAVGWGIGQIKIGGFSRGERISKINEGLLIEEELGKQAHFAGSELRRVP